MKKLSTLFLLVFAVVQAWAVAPESGKVYKLIAPSRGDFKVAEDIAAHNTYCPSDLGDKGYSQMWILTQSGNSWTIKNVYTGRYLQNNYTMLTSYSTATTEAKFDITVNSSLASNGHSGYYRIMNAGSNSFGLHCDASNNLVPYYTDTESPGGSSWQFELVNISEEEILAAQAEYAKFAESINDKSAIVDAYTAFYDDNLCMQLKSEYASMSDDELKEAMSALPEALVEISLKVKNNTWGTREKEFRVATYKPYSDPDYWGTKLLTKKYCWVNNPTGIYGNTGDVIYIFVGSDIPESATLQIDAITGNSPSGTRTTLTKGMNIVPLSRDQQTLFVIYTADTSGDKVIADFNALDIRIEGGIVNGFWDIERGHDDTDWVEISQSLATHPYIQVRGRNFIFNTVREYTIKEGYCKNTITDAIGWWDNMADWQWSIMGLDEVQPSRFNNKLCAITLFTGYQSATHYRTQYLASYLNNLFPYEKMMSNADNAWGPGHENGHVQQEAITPINCSEVSNNLFSNLTLYNLGRWTSRGGSVAQTAAEYEEGLSWPSRRGELAMRMYWQLYLYYHVAGNNPEFYPTLFKLLREDPIVKVGSSNKSYINKGSADLLHFAEKCCEASGEDMTAFFEAWGFFVPMHEQHYGDYADYYLTSTQEMIDATKAKMAEYPKKAAGIEFIEDRVEPTKRMDGIEGNRLYNSAGVTSTEAGDVGQYTQFLPEVLNNEAVGYSYKRSSTSIYNIEIQSEGASGAVGFRVYDAAGNLVTFSNKYNFAIPQATAIGVINVVAVQANGTEVVLPTLAAVGDSEEQLEALEASLALAGTHVKLIADSIGQAGYYYSDVAANLKECYDGALSAKENADESVHTYGEWSLLLDAEVAKITSEEYATIPIKEHNYYKLMNAQRASYALTYSSSGLTGSTGTVTGDTNNKLWEFVSAGAENEYYIKSKSGNYITSITRGGQVKASSSDESRATVFVVQRHPSNGAFVLNRKDSTDLALSYNHSSNSTVVGASVGAAARWKLFVVVDGASAYEAERLSQLLENANYIADLVCDSRDGAVIKENVHQIADNFVELLDNLIAAIDAAEAAKETAPDLHRYIETLENSIDAISGAYYVAPKASTADAPVWYYIKNVETGLYCGLNESGTSASALATTFEDMSGKENNPEYWWSFTPTGNENEYTLANAYNGNSISEFRGYLVAKSTNSVPYILSVDDKGLTIFNGTKYWATINTVFVQLNATNDIGHWVLEEVPERYTAIESVSEEVPSSASGIYDIFGRKVDSISAPGLYIVNGKKVIIK